MLSHRLGPRMRIAIPVAVSITWVLTSGSLGASPPPPPSPAEQPWIVYHWGHLGLVHPDGSGDHHIATEFSWDLVDEGAYFGVPQNPDWSPDGLGIAFNGERAGDPHVGLPIWSWDLEAGVTSALVPCTGTCQLVFHPAFSPDGASIAYARHDSPDPDRDPLSDRTSIEVMDLATGEARTVFEWRLGDPGPARSLWYPRWSPDARSLVISIFRTDDAQTQVLDSAIAIVDAAGPPNQEPFMLTDWSLLAGYADWRPVDDLIVAGNRTLSLYRQETEPVNLFTIRADGTGFRWITDFGDHDVRATQPTWTQDGSRIVFTHVGFSSGNPDGWSQLATIGPDGEDIEIITRGQITGGERAQGRLQPTQ